MIRLPVLILLLIRASLPDTLTLKTLAAPTNKPTSLSTLSVPVVVVLAVARMKSVLSRLSRVCALVALPPNTGDPEFHSVIPLYTVGKVETMGAAGVKLASLLTMATRTLFTYSVVTKCGVAPESLMVSGTAPVVP